MECVSSMYLRKTCPKCDTVVHVKRAACGCGHKFALKRKGRRSFENESVKRRRAVECEEVVMQRKDKERVRKVRERAGEMPEKTLLRRQRDRICKESMRASETCEESSERREQNRTRMMSTRASETCEETTERREQNRTRMMSTRASETCEEITERREQNRTRMMSTRASETCEETTERREQGRVYKESMRASETCEETTERREQNRTRLASMRAYESHSEMLQRKTSNKDNMAKLRQRTVTVENAILVFEHEIKLGPDFVCTCCHRMMYRKSVVPCNRGKYTKASSDVLEKVFSFELRYISPDDKEWVYKTCDRTLVRGSMPVQAKANGLKLCEIPSELSRLNVLELRLICLRVPFMKMVALPAGKQKSIHGPAVNVPSKVDTICNVLPCLPSQTELVPLKLKRKLAYSGHYMYDYVIPQVVLDALRFLKSSNPLYALVIMAGLNAGGLQSKLLITPLSE